jgi:hypothetical protein
MRELLMEGISILLERERLAPMPEGKPNTISTVIEISKKAGA